MAIEDYRLMVAGLSNSVYIGRPTKTPHLMSSSRRKVPKEEFIAAILQWSLGELQGKKDSIVSITLDDKVVAEIHIKDKKEIQ